MKSNWLLDKNTTLSFDKKNNPASAPEYKHPASRASEVDSNDKVPNVTKMTCYNGLTFLNDYVNHIGNKPFRTFGTEGRKVTLIVMVCLYVNSWF